MKKSDANDNQPDGILLGFQSSLAERTRSEFFEFQQLDTKPKNFFSIHCKDLHLNYSYTTAKKMYFAFRYIF